MLGHVIEFWSMPPPGIRYSSNTPDRKIAAIRGYSRGHLGYGRGLVRLVH
jgi:hypothetical protein